MRILEQRIIESGEASMANTSLVEMQQVAILIIILYSYSFEVCIFLYKAYFFLSPFFSGFVLTDSHKINDSVQ